MAIVTLGQVLTTCRTYLNDDNATVWTDPILIPKVQEAHRELQTKLWEVGSPAVRAVSPGNVIGIGQVNLIVPADNLICPFKLVESSSPPAGDYLPMTEISYIEDLLIAGIAPTNRIIYWAWRGENILLNAATVARQIMVFYRAAIRIPQVSTDGIGGIAESELYLAARAAAMAAGSVGNKDVYELMTALANENFNRVVFSNRGQQKPVNRP